MRAEPNNMHQLKSKQREEVKARFNQQRMRPGVDHRPLINITFADVYRRIAAGLQRLGVAIKYRFYQITAGLFERFRFPWLKVGIAALAIFIVLKKDIHFSINMQAPLGAAADDPREDAGRTDEMSLVKAVRLQGEEAEAGNSLPGARQLEAKKVEAYVKRFSKVAAAEMDKFGIPASIKMAQGLLESEAGENLAARQANNHFGFPMAGSTYNSAWENWRAHSLLVSEEYARAEWGRDYRKWARGLEQAGYNPARDYAEKLVEIIDVFHLYQLDEK